MKKLVIISVITAIMIALSIVEIVRCTQIFASIEDTIIAIRVGAKANEPNTDNEQMLDLAYELEDIWTQNKNFLLIFNNHSTVRTLDEKIVATLSSIRENRYPETMEYSATALSLCQDLKDESHPSVTNLFNILRRK